MARMCARVGPEAQQVPSFPLLQFFLLFHQSYGVVMDGVGYFMGQSYPRVAPCPLRNRVLSGTPQRTHCRLELRTHSAEFRGPGKI